MHNLSPELIRESDALLEKLKMRIGIVSDIHDNVWTLQAALTRLHNADILICCGDLCSPFTVSLMADGFSGPIRIVDGNNEGDWPRITQQVAKYAHVHLYGEFFQEEIALRIAQSGKYDLVCYGHNHRFAMEQRGSTLTPGTLLGYFHRL